MHLIVGMYMSLQRVRLLANRLLHLREVPVQLRRNERDTVEQLLDHGVLVLLVLLRDLGLLDLGFLIDGLLDGLCVASVLRGAESVKKLRRDGCDAPRPRTP